MSESLLIELASHGTLLAVVWFFLRRLLDQFDKVVNRVAALELFEARTDERHDAEDRAGGVRTRE